MKDLNELYRDETFLSEILNAIPSCVIVIDTEHYIVLINKAGANIVNKTPGDCFERRIYEVFNSNLFKDDAKILKICMEEDKIISGQDFILVEEKQIPIEYEIRPLKNIVGAIVGAIFHFVDITKRIEEEKMLILQKEELIKKNEEYIRHLQNEILELSTPVIQVWDGIIALPLVGTLDSYRAKTATTRILESIESTKSQFVIIDITGVPTVDEDVAKHILQTIYAIRLLGAEAIISGLSPNIAITIAKLNLNLSDIKVCGKMADALNIAINEIQKKKELLKKISLI